MNNILLIGAGGHAKACIDVIEQQGIYEIYGLVDAYYQKGTKILGYPILGTDDDLPDLLPFCQMVLIAVGQIKTPYPRIKLFKKLKELGFHLPNIISPYAYVSSHAILGQGNIVMHGAIIQAGVKIGNNCIINSRALLEHDVTVADYCHISTSSTINGAVRVGEGTFIGSGSVIRESLIINNYSIIGMGKIVKKDFVSDDQPFYQKDVL